MNERMKHFRSLQAQYNVGNKSFDAYLVECSSRDPHAWRQVVLQWFEDHPSMVEVTTYCSAWYLVDGGQAA